MDEKRAQQYSMQDIYSHHKCIIHHKNNYFLWSSAKQVKRHRILYICRQSHIGNEIHTYTCQNLCSASLAWVISAPCIRGIQSQSVIHKLLPKILNDCTIMTRSHKIWADRLEYINTAHNTFCMKLLRLLVTYRRRGKFCSISLNVLTIISLLFILGHPS